MIVKIFFKIIEKIIIIIGIWTFIGVFLFFYDKLKVFQLGKGLCEIIIFVIHLLLNFSLGTIMLVSFFDIWTIFGLILIGFGFIIITLKVF